MGPTAPAIASFARRLLLLPLIVAVWTNLLHNDDNNRPHRSLFSSAISIGKNSNNIGGGFNYEIEKRVFERVSELMSVPVTMLGLVEQYASTDVFEPPFLRPHQKDDIFRFMWTVWKEFNVDLYYGQEDGLFLGLIKGSGTYQEGRGTNGYLTGESFDSNQRILSEEDTYMKRLYYDKCLDRETGEKQNCTLQHEEDFVFCIDDCRPTPCPSEVENKIPESPKDIIYCPQYRFSKVPASYGMGYIPRYYYCLNNAGNFIENDPPNSVASPSSMSGGICTHSDGITMVNGKTRTKQTYAMADRQNYMFLRDYDHGNDRQEANLAALQLYSDDPNFIDESQKSDQIFVGGHHSRRYEPRLRPWYIGTRHVQNAFWTKPYPFATNADMGISYGKPLYYTDPFTGRKVFRGVICVDYDLEEISRFLRDVFLEILGESTNPQTSEEEDVMARVDDDNEKTYSSSNGATVLIVEDDDPHFIIGSSTGSKAAQKVRVDDESIICKDEEVWTAKYECKTVRSTPMDYFKNTNKTIDKVVALAFEAQKEARFPKELVVSAAPNRRKGEVDGENLSDFYVSQSLIYEQSEGENLRWRIIVAMPVGLATNDDLIYPDAMFVVVLAVGVVGCVSCLVLFYYYFRKRKNTEVRMSDWRFTSAFILGCALLNLTTLTYLGPATDVTCMARMWAFHIVFVVALMPLLVKVWRIYKLVGSADRAVRLTITNGKAVLYTMPAILLQAVILTMFSIFDPASRYTYVDIDGSSSYQHSICKHNSPAFTVTQVIFEGGLLLCGCILAFKTRNLGSTLGEAKQLLFAMYNVALVGVIVLLLGSFLQIDQKSVYVIQTLGIFWATVFSSCAFVLPRLMQVQRNQLQRRRSSCNTPQGSFHISRHGQSGSLYGSGAMSTNGPPTAPTAPSSTPLYMGTSMVNEPRSTIVNVSSVNSSEFRSTIHENPARPSSSRSFGEDEFNISDDDEPLKEGGDRQKHRNTSFTKLSISPSERDIIENLAEDSGSGDDVEANVVVLSEADVVAISDDEKVRKPSQP